MMHIPLSCQHCVNAAISAGYAELQSKGYLDYDEEQAPVAEIREDSIYDVVCSKGHSSRCVLLNEKFELLFDLGFNALVDGYYRDAVSSFYASYERFFEFCIRFFLCDKATDGSYIKTWKLVQNQSERQLGAYLFLYLHVAGQEAPNLTEKWVSFRNSVIHKGKIPSREDALEFGEAVRVLVNQAIGRLKEIYGQSLIHMYESPLRVFQKDAGASSAHALSTILSVRFGPRYKDGEYRNWPLKDMIPKVLEARGTTRYIRISRP